MSLAHAMEHVHLHRRLALFVLSMVGSSTKWYALAFILHNIKQSYSSISNRSMAGLMAVTAFLSMWINNSAATSIMIPAAIAIADELQNHQQEMQKKSVIHNDENRRKSKEILPLEATGTKFLHFDHFNK